MDCNAIRGLLPAYTDRELGLRDTLDIETHLQTCPACHEEYMKQSGLRTAVKRHATYFAAPDRLEHRIKAALAKPPRPTLLGHWAWGNRFNLGAALVSVVALAWSIGLYLTLPSAGDRLAEEIITSHARSLISNHTVDVASSDQHTVKPWYNGKLDFSPPVTDFTTEGFPLVGGRLDYLNHRLVAALVYRHSQHMINLFVMPSINDKNISPESFSKQGYYLLHWNQAGMDFWAVSDVDPNQLRKFKEVLLARAE